MKKLNRNQQSVIPRLLESSARGATRMRMFLMLMIMMMTSAFAMAQETYGIKIAGEDVTSNNCDNLTEISGVNGTVYFDPNTRTLTLDNATIETEGNNAILNETCKDLVIKLIGTNTIDVREKAAIVLQEKTTIMGASGSKFTVLCNKSAVLFDSCPLEISNCWLEAEGAWGISAYNNAAEEVLTIRNSHVEAKGTTGSICDIADLKLEGCYIDEPVNAAYDADVKSVALNGVAVTDKVVIKPDSYGVHIAGVDVTDLNYKDLSGIDGVEGKLSYDPATNTLTMEDVTIYATVDNVGIYAHGKNGLKIRVVGNNTITASNYSCISTVYQTTISGFGTLRLNSSGSCGILMSSSLYVEGISLYTEGLWGIAGQDNQTSGNELTICNAYVEATGRYGSICDVEDLHLVDCSITQPEGAAFDTGKHAVTLNGEKVTDKVVIEPVANGISDITTDVPAHAKGIYSVTGVKQTQQWNELPAGIYIVDGVKRVKR